MNKVDWTDEARLRQLVAESTSQSEVLKKLNLTPASNMITFRKYAAKYNLDTSHFAQVRTGIRKQSLDKILVENSTRAEQTNLKRRLVRENVLEYICEKCENIGTWQGQPLSLQLEHKNGNNTDYRKENLCFLCPNCHSQTSTFAGRNKKH